MQESLLKKKFSQKNLPMPVVWLLIAVIVLTSIWRVPLSVRADHWFNPGYQYRRTLTINGSLITGTAGETHTNFPVLISITDPDFRWIGNPNPSDRGLVQNSGGFDIIFADAPTGASHLPPVQLPHEKESYDPVTGQIRMWVRVPSLTVGQDINIYIYYGNTNITSSQENTPANVWSNGFQAVWHLKESASICPLTFFDSTVNQFNGACFSNPAFTTAGQIDGARNFNGTGISISPNVPIQDRFTYETWVNINTLNPLAYRTIMGNYGGSSSRLLGINSSNPPKFQFFDGSVAGPIIGPTANVGLQHIAVTSDGTNVNFYLNGAPSGSPTPRVHAPATIFFGLGYAPAVGGEYFNGIIDEVRVSTITRTAGWIQTGYNNTTLQGIGPSQFIKAMQATPDTGNAAPGIPTLTESTAFSFAHMHTPNTRPVFESFSAIDAEGDALEYEIQWDTNSAFSAPIATRNSSNYATNGFNATNFSSGAPVSYAIEASEPLSNNVTYWWRVRARDPAGSGRWGSYSVPRSITINTALLGDAWFQTTDAQFQTGVLTNTVVTGSGGLKIIGW